jgi:hypothetical protein
MDAPQPNLYQPQQQTPQAIPPSSPSPVPSAPHTRWGLVLGIIVLGIAACAGAYFALGKKYDVAEVIPTYTPRETDSTANWQTYTNAQYGFEVQIPNQWSVSAPYESTKKGISIYGPQADLPSITLTYYATLVDVPFNPVTRRRYDYFDQYVMNTQIFKDQKIISLGDGRATSAVLVADPTTRVVLISGNGHFYEFSYQVRYEQTWHELDQILSTFKFTDDKVCIQVITGARNPQTGEVRDFPTPCDVPAGWVKI